MSWDWRFNSSFSLFVETLLRNANVFRFTQSLDFRHTRGSFTLCPPYSVHMTSFVKWFVWPTFDNYASTETTMSPGRWRSHRTHLLVKLTRSDLLLGNKADLLPHSSESKPICRTPPATARLDGNNRRTDKWCELCIQILIIAHLVCVSFMCIPPKHSDIFSVHSLIQWSNFPIHRLHLIIK